MKDKKFQTRGFVSLLTFFGFIVMSVTGIILYLTPQGRIAYWTDWKLFGLTKVDWGNIHILSCFLFLIVGSFHLYYNWKPLTHYFTEKASKGLKLKRELVISSLIILFIIVGAIYQIQPLKSVIALNDFIKDSWIVSREYEPPFGHAEELSLKTFAKKMKIDLEKALPELKEKGIKVEDEKDSLQKIARMNKTSPMQLYVIIKKFEEKPEIVKKDAYTPEMIEEQFSGTGLGRKLFSEVCQEIGVDMNQAKEKLKEKGIVVKEDETFRKIAERYEMNPIDILKILLVKSS
jgi:hypothetical protein